jgi:Kef-type K+ transport system membrane component KefB
MRFATLLLQIAVVLATARAVGLLFRRLRQPQVAGEMLGGILLGPSVLGALAPRLEASLFPADSLDLFDAVSRFGLVLFMFLVGTKLDLQSLRGRGAKATVLISHLSIAVPFVLGGLLALLLHPSLSHPDVRRLHFTLFLGTAMSITAFPVLARILTEEGLVRTSLGAIALACAAVDDVTAWCILAGVVILVRAAGSALPLWVMIPGLAAHVLAMVLLVRPALGRLRPRERAGTAMTHAALGALLLVMLLSAWVAERLGIHAVFGAFLAGAVVPRGRGLARALSDRLEDVTVVLLVPLFFASAGLRTRVGLLADPWLFAVLALVLLVAIAGKVGGAVAAARLCGISWRQSAALGVLMNTRGLMELVVLNVGLEIGVISPALYTIMVLMALVTTLMTVPLLRSIAPPEVGEAGGEAAVL